VNNHGGHLARFVALALDRLREIAQPAASDSAFMVHPGNIPGWS
jgi:hypothetical protein